MAITHVQNANGGASGAASSIPATGAAVGNGNSVCGAVFWHNTSGTLTSVTDDKGNTYTIEQKVQDSGGGNFFLASFYLTNITNGPSTITGNLSASTTGTQLTWDEYTGFSATPSLDGHGGQAQSAPGTGANAITTGNFTTTLNGDLVWACVYSGSGTMTAGTSPLSFTRRLNSVATNGIVFMTTEDAIQAAASASTAATSTQGTASSTNIVALALGVSGAAAITPWPFMRGLRVH